MSKHQGAARYERTGHGDPSGRNSGRGCYRTVRLRFVGDSRAGEHNIKLGHEAVGTIVETRSGAEFHGRGSLPIAAFVLVSTSARAVAVVACALLALLALGIAGARSGGAPMLRAAVRVCVGAGLAMAVTAAVGQLVGGIGT